MRLTVLNNNFHISYCFEFEAFSYFKTNPAFKEGFYWKIGLQLVRNK